MTIADELRALITSMEHKENDCRYYLQHAGYLLIPEHFLKLLHVETEHVGNLGRSDYVISAEIWHGGESCNRAYIWELKSPQCYIFEKDPTNNNRLKPTAELIDAENKLLHYYYENKYSTLFHQQFDLSHPAEENVCLGGIIIGSNRTKVRNGFEPAQKKRLYRTTRLARGFMYDPARIKIKTWDEILSHICASEVRRGEEHQGEIEIPVSEMSPDTISTFDT